jgi:hypothetical protein
MLCAQRPRFASPLQSAMCRNLASLKCNFRPNRRMIVLNTSQLFGLPPFTFTPWMLQLPILRYLGHRIESGDYKK